MAEALQQAPLKRGIVRDCVEVVREGREPGDISVRSSMEDAIHAGTLACSRRKAVHPSNILPGAG
jgi:hypothetical protein